MIALALSMTTFPVWWPLGWRLIPILGSRRHHVAGGSLPTPNDPGTLDFMVFSLTWMPQR